jgi:hypothetical protein
MLNSVTKFMKGESPSLTSSVKPQLVSTKVEHDRTRLHFFDRELAKANDAVADLIQRIATLENIGIDAAEADKALQAYIGSDGGIDALHKHASGNTSPDDLISKLIAAARSTAEAAAPAKAALPATMAALDFARNEVNRLGAEKNAEIGRFMTQLGDGKAAEYKHCFEKLCRLHSELSGFARGVASLGIEVALNPVDEILSIPRYELPSLACQFEYDIRLRYQSRMFDLVESEKLWNEVKTRVSADVDADISDLI